MNRTDDTNSIDLDRAIDEAARQLTAGEPTPDFRAAVIARLGRSDPRHGRWLIAPLAVAAALAGIFVTLTVERTQRGIERPARPIQRGDIAIGHPPAERI